MGLSCDSAFVILGFLELYAQFKHTIEEHPNLVGRTTSSSAIEIWRLQEGWTDRVCGLTGYVGCGLPALRIGHIIKVLCIFPGKDIDRSVSIWPNFSFFKRIHVRLSRNARRRTNLQLGQFC